MKSTLPGASARSGRWTWSSTLTSAWTPPPSIRDIVLPAATWYEKDDLNTTDMHSFINPMQAAVPPAWESRSDWDIFKAIAKKVSELAAVHLPDAGKRYRHAARCSTTHPMRLTQPQVKDWTQGEIRSHPGQEHAEIQECRARLPAHLRPYGVSLGPASRRTGWQRMGSSFPVGGHVRRTARAAAAAASVQQRQGYLPLPGRCRESANAILHLDPASNGEVAYRAFQAEEHKTGLTLTDLAEGSRRYPHTPSPTSSPNRAGCSTSPTWSGILNKGRAYAPFILNKERLVPWRTLTGRQHFYLDHDDLPGVGRAPAGLQAANPTTP